MSSLREPLYSEGRSWLGAAALSLVCLALLLAHGGPGLEHMETMEHGPADGPVKVVMSVCLAVIAGAAVLLGAWNGLRRRRPGAWLVQRFRPAAHGIRLSSKPLPAARAGPAQFQVFLR